MKLSPSTLMYAARGLGDRLAEAGVAPEALDHAPYDANFADMVREQVAFRTGNGRPQRTTEGALLSLAVAHAAGRMTGAVHTLIDDLEAAWPRLDAASREEIERTVRQAMEEDRLGMAVDVRRWREMLRMAGEHAVAEPQGAPAP